MVKVKWFYVLIAAMVAMWALSPVAAGSDVTDNLTARWNFDSDALDTAPNGTANDGTLHNGPTYNTSDHKVGTASMSFVAGSAQWVQVDDQADVSPTDKITVCLWMKRTTVSNNQVVMAKTDQWGAVMAFRLWMAWGRTMFDIGSTQLKVDGTQPPANVWTHVAVTYDGSAIKLYFDSVEKGTQACSGLITESPNPPNYLYIGTCNGEGKDSYDGLLDDVRIYNGKALTAEEIATVMSMSGAAAPTFSPAAGTYDAAQVVTISTATSGASIRYTLDGTTPSDTVGTEYTGPVSISAATLKAIAYKDGIPNSPVTTGVYDIRCTAPTFDPAPGTYNPPISVAISTATSGASIRYTIDGATPSDTAGTVYSVPVTITTFGTHTLKAVAYKDDKPNSVVATGVYVVTPDVIDNLTARWNFENDALDTAPRGTAANNGTQVNGPTCSSVSKVGIASMRFIASSKQWVEVADQADVNPTDKITICLWMNRTTSSNNQIIMAKVDYYMFNIGFRLWQAWGATMFDLGPTQLRVDGTQPPANVWTHVAVTYDGSAIKLYVDGVEKGTKACTGAIPTVASSFLLMGSGSKEGKDPYDGLLDDVRIYSGKALTAEEIGTVMSMSGAAAPRFTPAAGTYDAAQSVAISTVTPGATIRYTLDGTDPSDIVGTLYTTEPVSISTGTTDTTLKAIAYKAGIPKSSVTTGVYHFECAAPRFTPAAGTYDAAQSVAISSTEGATIYYTTDGVTEPSDTDGTLYTEPVTISISAGTTLKAIAYKSDMAASSVTTGDYVIECTAPTFDPVAGTYNNPQSVTISTTTEGATIYYTTDDTDPSDTEGIEYTEPVTISVGTTLKAIACKAGILNSTVSAAVYVIKCAAPTFDPAEGTYNSAQSVAISTVTEGATIYYSTDGYDPSDIDGIKYTVPVSISEDTTLKAIAYKAGILNSPVSTAVYLVACEAPTFTPAGGTYDSAQSVTISTTTVGASIRYTIDGSEPSNTAGTLYTVPVDLSADTTLKAIAYGAGIPNSPVTTGVYAIRCVAPTFNPPAGMYATLQSVTISTTTSDASIYYTTDGTAPTTSSTLYSTPVSLTDDTTLKAIVHKEGIPDSAVTSGGYVFASDVLSNLVCRWNFDGNATDTAPNGTPNNGTLIGGPTYNTTDYKMGTASMSFVANSKQCVQVADQADMNPTDKITICLWMKRTAMTSSQVIMAKADFYAYVLNYRLWTAYGSQTKVDIAGTQLAVNPGIPAANVWTHVAVTYDGSAIKLYFDGAEVGSKAWTGPIAAVDAPYLFIGTSNGEGKDSYDGLLDDVRIYNGKALTAAEIATVMSAVYAVEAPMFSPPPGLYDSTQSVAISTATLDATIYCTVDGTRPNATTGTLYAEPVSISATTTLRAIACKAGCTDSSVTTGLYNFQCQAPTFSPPEGTYNNPQSVAISSVTPDTTIRYTTDGTDPSDTEGIEYTEPVSISVGITLKAIACKAGIANSTVSSGDYTIQCAALTFNPAAGTYNNPQSVTISTVTEGASIRYTTDWSEPSDTEGIVYTGPITISVGTTLMAIAYKADILDSAVSVADYVIECAAPTFNPAAGSYNSVQSVTISTVTEGASIRYTIDGSEPSDTEGTEYTGPVSISGDTTLMAIAYKTDILNSTVSTADYLVACAAPTFNPPAAAYSNPQSVTISTATEGATIHYTIDGSEPSDTAGTLYTEPLSISVDTTLKAIAYKADIPNSPVTTGFYAIRCGAPTFDRPADTYTTERPVTVSISTATEGATIYYTTDGYTEPSATAGTVYTVPLVLSTNTTLKAIACKPGMPDSFVTSGEYVFVEDVTTNLVCRWDFENNASDTAPFGTAANNGTLIGGPTYSPDCKIRTASMSFVANSIQQVLVPDQADLRPADKITICLWVKPTSLVPGSPNIVCKGLSPVEYRLRYVPYNPGPHLQFDLLLASGDTSASASLPFNNVWTHVAATYDGSTLKLYKDGAQEGSTSVSSTIPPNTGDLSIGCRTDRNGAGDSFDGLIDDVRIYSGKALTAGEIYVVMAAASGGAVAAPTFSPEPGTYTTAQSVTISSATPDATIYYTTDGTDPAINGTAYTGPVSISEITTLRAIAVKENKVNSYLTSGVYVIQLPVATIAGFVATDQTSGSSLVTNAATVDVAITVDIPEGVTVTGYVINETGVEPTGGWADTAPTTYTIQAGSGATVTLYAWIKGSNNEVASKSATICYNTATPAITAGPTVTDNGDGTATATWTTDIPALGSVNYGPVKVSGATPNIVAETAIGTSHSVVLTGIVAGTNYNIVLVNNEIASPAIYWPDKWPVPGDASQDCRVNILDLIFIRNKLNQAVGTGDNWKADINEDARINILDLIFVRNKLNTQCPQ